MEVQYFEGVFRYKWSLLLLLSYHAPTRRGFLEVSMAARQSVALISLGGAGGIGGAGGTVDG